MWNEILSLLKQELVLVILLFMLLFIKVSAVPWRNEGLLNLVNGLLLVNLVTGLFMTGTGSTFGQLFHTNGLIVLEKDILNLGTLILSLQGYQWLKRHDHLLEFYLLLLSSLLGLFFMISAGNLLLFYLGLELSAIPLAALCNFDLLKRRSSEAAMKFVMSSAFASGLLLLGISLVYGITGSLDFGTIMQRLGEHSAGGGIGVGISGGMDAMHSLGTGAAGGMGGAHNMGTGALAANGAAVQASMDGTGNALLLFSFILLFAGFAFKISVVPFHLWTADVYEGSPVPVTAYLSVVSKGAIFFVLVPVLFTVFRSLAWDWYRMVSVLAVLTMLTGNLFAIRQNNLKRLLAFSSIVQVGFILVGISGGDRSAMASVVYFVLIYLFSNLGAFGVVGLISSLTGREEVADYKGLYKTNPFLSWVLAISLFSLAGIPPTAGFFGKFFLLLAGAGKGNYVLIVIAALNMIISLYYYLRVVRAIFMEDSDRPLETLKVPLLPGIAMFFCMAGMIGTGLVGGIYDYIYSLSNIGLWQ